MYTLVLVLHFIACILLIMLILMQSGKGSAAGIFGSSNSDSVFSSPTAATFISKFTAAVAIFIMVTSITLTIISKDRGMTSIIDKVNIPVTQSSAQQ